MKYRASMDKNPALYGFGYWPRLGWRWELRRWLTFLFWKLLIILSLWGARNSS